MSKNITSASIVAGLLVLWLVSGLWDDRSVPPDPALAAAIAGTEPALSAADSRVRVELKHAEPRMQSVV